MSPAEAVRSALENLAAHKLRSALTMLGMIFGVGAVIAMLSIGAGAERQALAMIERLGLRNVLVRAKPFKDDELQEIRRKSPGVSARDAAAIAEAVRGVRLVAPRIRIEPYNVRSASGRAPGAEVYGVSAAQAELSHLVVAEGRFLDPLDERQHAQVGVIGPAVRRELFGFGPALGQRLKINDVWLEVVGVLAGDEGAAGAAGSTFEGIAVGSVAHEIYLPAATAERKFEHPVLQSPLDEIVVNLAPGTGGGEAASLIDDLLARLHGGAADYEVVVPEALLAQSRRTQRLFNLVMGCIAGISLLVGGIGIMNIMLATVLERTREIGVRRAVGARRGDIRFQFVVESFAISLIGGLTGVTAGVVIARVVAAFAGWQTEVTGASILLSTGVAMTVGLISGIYPATRAAALDPIEALHYE
ncbi:MAG TPA: ABC transporter permease [Thermoanaerobaculia bacterium]|nr:ABC transporter permease [Thermoanaerobaculia bacterium]